MPTKKDTSNDGGAAEVQAAMDEATSKGYFGTVPDPNPNEAYSIQSGPDSPTAAETRTALTADASADEPARSEKES